MATCVMAASVA